MLFEQGPYKLDIAADRTRHFYESHSHGSCTCPGCRNFLEAYPLLPEEVKQFFRQFGVDIAQPEELSPIYSPDGTMTFYDGAYLVCGTILEGKEPYIRTGDRQFQPNAQYVLKLTGDAFVIFTQLYGMPDADFPQPAFRMEFQCALPWVLKESNPYHFTEPK